MPSELPTGTITFLFTDIEGSTKLLQRLGAAYHGVLDDHASLMRAALAAGEGVEIATEGDSFFVVFPNASKAVAAAAEAQRAFAAYPWPEGVEIRVRMGMHTGEATLGGDNYIGIDVNRAARIASAGHGGQVLLSDATRSLVERSLPKGVSLRDLGEHRLKDLDHPEHLSQLVFEDLPSDFPPPRTEDSRVGNIPSQLTTFVGREAQVAEIRRLLEGTRLLTLTGPGGTGKTRLSIEVASAVQEELADGAWFVALAPITDPELVVTTIARALGLREDPDRPVLDVLIDHLRGKELLLVLDNFEQVTDAAPRVGELLAATEGTKVLVSSREALRIHGEAEYGVPPLALPDLRNLPPLAQLSEYEAVRLFIDRGRSVKPGFEATEGNAPAIAEITYRLDGLPLAIELAAARVKLLQPEAILARLGQSLELLSGGARDLPERQQTLRGAIAWSYDLLDEAEQRFFRRLAVFRGGFTFEAAEAVTAGGDLDAFDGVASLVNKSLVRQIETDHGEPRFFMLETIRDYAAERLAESAKDDREARMAHATFFREFVARARGELTGAEQARWLDLLAHEHDNLRTAIEWAASAGEVETALRIGSGLWRFWQMRGHLREAAERLSTLLELPGAADHPEARADALEAAGGVFYWMGRWEEAERYYAECVEARRALGDPAPLAEATYNLSFVFLLAPPPARDQERASALLEEALSIFREQDDRSGIAKVLWGLSNTHQMANHWEPAIERALEARELFRELGDRFGEGWALWGLGIANAALGRIDEARSWMTQGLELFAAAGDVTGIALLLDNFSILAALEGDHERAARLRGASLNAERQSGQGLVTSADTTTPWPIAERQGPLSPEEWDRLGEEGAAMSHDEAVAYALKTE